MDKLICITSHCNSKDKIDILKSNIELFKNKGYDILLFSHIPLPRSIVTTVDHYVYNNDNQILNYPDIYQINRITIKNGDKWVQLQRYTSTIHWAYLNQLKYIGHYCSGLSYNHYLFINYDVNITDNMLQYIKDQNYNFKDIQLNPNTGEETPSNLLFQLCKDSLLTLHKQLNKEQFIEGWPRNSEAYLQGLIEELNIPHKKYPESIRDQIQCDFNKGHIYHTNYNKENDYFKVFYNEEYIILFDIKRPIKFNIDGIDYTHKEYGSHKHDFKQIGYYDNNNNLIDIKYMFNDDKCHLNYLYEYE